MKIFWALAVFAFVVLGAAAVWLGGLNQDEGWYLYAANLVAEGKVLYRDFFYTQGPVFPMLYADFCWVWRNWGLLGARILTLSVGLAGLIFTVLTARRLVSAEGKSVVSLIVFLLLGSNLYHLYYLAIPKTYALASLLVMMGFFYLTWIDDRRVVLRVASAALAGFVLAVAAGTRISLGALLAVVGFVLLLQARRYRLAFLWFGIGGAIGLALCYGVYLKWPQTRAGLIAAQQYHAARGGFDLVWTVGSVSRLVRWYLPVFIMLGLGVAGGLTQNANSRESGESSRMGAGVLLWGFLAVFAVQMLAPFPYEDYQVPIMGLLAVYAAVNFTKNVNTPSFTFTSHLHLLLVLGLCFANSFGSPLLEKWMTNGQDRFWSLKKEKCELAQLRDVAKRIEALDPGGKELFTQDTYLAIETNRKVPIEFAMGPYAVLSDDELKRIVTETTMPIAALSGYSFAPDMPSGRERRVEAQMACWTLLKQNYKLVDREEAFGQNATPLLILKRK